MLKATMERLAGRPEVLGAALVSTDGLPVQSTLPAHLDLEALAALVATMMRHTVELGRTVQADRPRRFVAEFGEGALVVAPIDSEHSVLLLTHPGADLGELLFLLRQEQDDLATLL